MSDIEYDWEEDARQCQGGDFDFRGERVVCVGYVYLSLDTGEGAFVESESNPSDNLETITAADGLRDAAADLNRAYGRAVNRLGRRSDGEEL